MRGDGGEYIEIWQEVLRVTILPPLSPSHTKQRTRAPLKQLGDHDRLGVKNEACGGENTRAQLLFAAGTLFLNTAIILFFKNLYFASAISLKKWVGLEKRHRFFLFINY